MNYNQKLAQYNVGKDAVSSGKTAYNEGKAQLDAGWDAYNEGSEQLKNYDKAKAQYDESLAAYNKLTKAISDLEAKLHGEYLKASISYSVTNITRLLAIVSAVIALLKLSGNVGTAKTKLEALKSAGVHVVYSPRELAAKVAELL